MPEKIAIFQIITVATFSPPLHFCDGNEMVCTSNMAPSPGCFNQVGYKGAALGVALSRTHALCKTSL